MRPVIMHVIISGQGDGGYSGGWHHICIKWVLVVPF